MNKVRMDWPNLLPFALAVVSLLVSSAAALAQDSPKPPTRESDPKPVIYGCHEVIKDYELRFPHFKEMKEWQWKGLEKSDRPDIGGSVSLKSTDTKLEAPPKEHHHQQAKAQQSGDPYINRPRPQYWPMVKPCGTPGIFLRPTPSYIRNHSKVARGEGGAVPVTQIPPPIPPCYVQPLLMDPNAQSLSKEGDQALWEYELTTFGLGPISDTQYQIIERQNHQRFLELFFDPERWSYTAKAAGAVQHEQMSTNMAQTADSAQTTAVDTIEEHLLNVANENAAEPVSGNPSPKSKQQAIYMVQQMYKQVYIPMAILLLLPGAILTQVKSMVQFGVTSTQDDSNDTKTPFQGIIKSIIAIFLIPATQLIVSYMIDVGNSLQYEVKRYVDREMILKYAHEQMPDSKIEKTKNALDEPTDKEAKDQGKGHHGPEKEAIAEKKPPLSKGLEFMYNFANYAMSTGITVLGAFQLVIMCYLFLLGPVAAALYAWPNVSKGSPGVFNKVFANWLDAVVVCSLWRFWWMVILATMTTYIRWSQEQGFFDPTNEWEMMVFTSFQVMLIIIPGAPFSFNAKPFVEAIEKEAAKQQQSKGGQQGQGQGQGQGGQGAGPSTPATSSTIQSSSPTTTTTSSTGSPSGGREGGSAPSPVPTPVSPGHRSPPPMPTSSPPAKTSLNVTATTPPTPAPPPAAPPPPSSSKPKDDKDK